MGTPPLLERMQHVVFMQNHCRAVVATPVRQARLRDWRRRLDFEVKFLVPLDMLAGNLYGTDSNIFHQEIT